MRFTIYWFYEVIGPLFRRKRLQKFVETFQLTEQTTILDVGGYYGFWWDLPVKSRITLLNIDDPPAAHELPSNFQFVRGDGRSLPFPDQHFDIVFSNSVIEHLRSFEDQRCFASESLRVGRAVWVQTPNRWFPIEPHFIALGVHYLPKRFQLALMRWSSVRGWVRAGDNVNFDDLFWELRLLTRREMCTLFPGCRVLRERVCGLTKSFIAVRTA